MLIITEAVKAIVITFDIGFWGQYMIEKFPKLAKLGNFN
jgi:hypothetical protein